MKIYKSLIVFLFTFTMLMSFAQSFNESSFEVDFMNYKPVQKENVKDKDFNFASMIIENTKKAVKDDKNGYNVSDYFNITAAFNSLKLPIADIKLAFLKMVNADGGCEYLIEFKDRAGFRETIPQLYEFHLNECLNSNDLKNRKDFNLDKYIAINNLDENLVNLLVKINEDDRKFRNISSIKNEQKFLDLKNQKIIDSLFSVYGEYIGNSMVGKKFQPVMWAVIQHSNIEMMEKYLPVIQSAVVNKELQLTPFKMLLDRYYGLKHGYQIFGSQSGFGFEMATNAQKEEIIKLYNLNELSKD